MLMVHFNSTGDLLKAFFLSQTKLLQKEKSVHFGPSPDFLALGEVQC